MILTEKYMKMAAKLISYRTCVLYVIISSLLIDVMARFGINAPIAFILYSWYFLITIALVTDLVTNHEIKPKGIYLILFVLASVVSNLFYPQLITSDTITTFQMMMFELFLCFGFFRLGGTEKDFQMLVRIMISFTLIMSFLSIVGVVSFLKTDALTADFRYRGLYKGVNEAGLYTVLGLSCSFYEMVLGFRKKINAVNVLVQSIMIWLCDSRTAKIAAVILVIGYFWYLFRKLRRWKRLFITLLCLIGFLGLGLLSMKGLAAAAQTGENESYGRNAYQDTVQADTSKITNADPDHEEALSGKSDLFIRINALSSDRLIVWETAVTAWKSSPITGYGVANAGKNYELFARYDNTHSLLFNLLLFSGILGTCCFGLFILTAFKRILKSWKNQRPEWKYMAVVVFSVFVISFLERVLLYDTKPITFMFWIIFGYLIDKNEKTEVLAIHE